VLRKALRIVVFVVLAALFGAAFALGKAHRGIRLETPALPDPAEVLALAAATDRPVRLSWIETARQCASADDESACITHSVFVLEWADGRLLLVDAGMEADAARDFGRPMELLLGNAPTRAGRAVAAALDGARGRVQGLVFTHLHMDHTQGIAGLCPPGAPPLPVFHTPAQVERGNYTVTPGLRQLEAAPCADPRPLADQGLAPLPGLPGVGVIRAAGHTPGSQLVVAFVGPDAPLGFVLAGDVVFAKAAIDADQPKELAYRLLVTPENEGQLARVRPWLRDLETEHGLILIPSHDRAHLLSLELPSFPFDGDR
jgi:glyoxylase-like metal-dependent hydrolase (beta-lactamase superfamily II)